VTNRVSFQDLPTEPLSFWIGVLLVMTFLAAVVYVATSGPLQTLKNCEEAGGIYVPRLNECQTRVPEDATPRP